VRLSLAAAGILAALIFGAGFATRVWTERPVAGLAPIARAAESLHTSADSLDTSIDRARPADSAAVAEPERAAGVHLQHAESVGDSVTLLRRRTDSLMTAAADADTLARRAIAALADERAAQQRQADELRAGVAKLQEALDSAKAVIARRAVQLEAMRIQRDKARALLGQALAVQSRRCGPVAMVGAGYGIRGADAGGFVGYGCRL
jgi:hypothetical protein